MAQMKDALYIADIKYPSSEYDIIWLLDQSSGHTKMGEDSLNASKLDKKPGGKQPQMRDILYNGKLKGLVFDDETTKGAETILNEGGVDTDTTGMSMDDMRKLLATHDNFKHETTILEKFIDSRGYQILFLPKFHCKLSPIIQSLDKRKNIDHALDSISVGLIWKFFCTCCDLMRAYCDSHAAGHAVENAVKVYKSHCRIHHNK